MLFNRLGLLDHHFPIFIIIPIIISIFIFSIIILIVISKIIITLIGVIRVVVQQVRPALLLLVNIVLLSAVRRSLIVLAKAQLNITRANIIFGIFQDLISAEDLEAALFVFSIKAALTLDVTARRIEINLRGL